MTTTTTTKTAAAAEKVEAPKISLAPGLEKLTPRIEEVRAVAGNLGGALSKGGNAYFTGLFELSRVLGSFGREIVTEAGEHVRATMQAKCLREAAELQAAYVQNRIEMSATHSKEIVDLARVKTEEVVAPFAELLKTDKKAA